MALDWMNIKVTEDGFTGHGYYGVQFAVRDPQGSYSSDIYKKFDLNGNHFSYTIDLSAVGCHCNAAAHFNRMPGPKPGESGSYYCDGNFINNQWCPEYDVFEGNKFTMCSTLHRCDNYKSETGWSSCDRGGCQTNAFYENPNLLCPEDRCTINTNRPFIVSHHQSSDLVNIWFSQEGREDSLSICKDPGYISGYVGNFDDVVFCSSLWGGSGGDMGWLDGMTGCGGDCDVDGSSVTFSGFNVWGDNMPPTENPSTEVTPKTTGTSTTTTDQKTTTMSSTTSEGPDGCPGGSLGDCIAMCPMQPVEIFQGCVAECQEACSRE